MKYIVAFMSAQAVTKTCRDVKKFSRVNPSYKYIEVSVSFPLHVSRLSPLTHPRHTQSTNLYTMINPRVFESLRARAEQEASARAAIDGLVEALERSVAYGQGVLSRVHATPRARYGDLLLPAAEAAVADETATMRQLAAVASAHPYYK